MKDKIKYFSAFSGIGGFELGIHSIFPNAECVGYGDRIYSPEGKSVALSALGGGRGAKTGLYLTWGVASRTRNGKKQIEHNGLEKANAMTSVQTDSMVDVGNVIRKLTPIECERLQTFPDNFTEKGISEKGNEVLISNTQRYKTLGNAVCVEVIKHIMRNFKIAEKRLKQIQDNLFNI